MEDNKDILIRINANGFNPIEITQRKDFSNNDVYANIVSLLSYKKQGIGGKWLKGDQNFPLGGTKFKIWCSDGERHDVDTYYHDEGIENNLLPNHRANAIISAGRFTSKDFDTLDIDCINQELKESCGSNFIVGDIVCKIPEGHPIPDMNIYGGSPIHFIMTPRVPSQLMIGEHGAQTAKNMVKYNMIRLLPNTVEDLRNPKWELTMYELIPSKCSSRVFIRLLQSWNIDVPKNMLVRVSRT